MSPFSVWPISWQAHPQSVEEVVFSSDFKSLYTNAIDGIIHRWTVNGENTKPICSSPKARERIYRLNLVPPDPRTANKDQLCYCVGEKLQFLDAETLQRVGEPRHYEKIRNPAVNPNGKSIVYDAGTVIHLIDRESGKLVKRFRRPESETSEDGHTSFFGFSSDGSQLASSSHDANRVRLWEVSSGRLVGTAVAPAGILKVDISPDGKQLAVTGEERLHLFEIAPMVEQRVAAMSSFPILSFEISPDGLEVAVNSTSFPQHEESKLAIWNLRKPAAHPTSQRPISKQTGNGLALAFSPTTPSRLAYGQISSLHVWQPETGMHRDITTDIEPEALAFRKSDRLWGIDEKIHRVVVWNPDTSAAKGIWTNRMRHERSGRANLRSLVVGRRWAAVGTRDGQIVVFDSEKETHLRTFDLGNFPIGCLAIHPDQSAVLTGEETGAIHYLRLSDGEILSKFAPHRDNVTAVAFAGPEVIVTGSADRTVKFWKPDGTLLFTLPLPGPVKQLRVTADGKTLVLLLNSERALRVWDLDKLWQRFRDASLDQGLPPLPQ